MAPFAKQEEEGQRLGHRLKETAKRKRKKMERKKKKKMMMMKMMKE